MGSAFGVFFKESSSSLAGHVSGTVILAAPHHARLTRTPSLLFPSHGDVPCDPRPKAQFGRLAEHGPYYKDDDAWWNGNDQ